MKLAFSAKFMFERKAKMYNALNDMLKERIIKRDLS